MDERAAPARPPAPDPDSARNRIVLPVLVPTLAFVGILLVVLPLSRILIASDKNIAVTVAMAASVGILMVASLLVARPIRGAELYAFMTIGAVALVGGGIYAASQGAPAHEGEEQHAGAGEGAGGEAAGPSKLRVVAIDIGFERKQLTTGAGEVEFEYVNGGMAPHTLVIENVPGFKLSVARQGETVSGKTTLKAGNYTFFCDVPGHREVGMEGTLTVG